MLIGTRKSTIEEKKGRKLKLGNILYTAVLRKPALLLKVIREKTLEKERGREVGVLARGGGCMSIKTGNLAPE